MKWSTASHTHDVQLGDLISRGKEENSVTTHLVHVSGILHYPWTQLCSCLQWLLFTGSHIFLLFQPHSYSSAFAAVNREYIAHCGVFRNQLLFSRAKMTN